MLPGFLEEEWRKQFSRPNPRSRAGWRVRPFLEQPVLKSSSSGCTEETQGPQFPQT